MRKFFSVLSVTAVSAVLFAQAAMASTTWDFRTGGSAHSETGAGAYGNMRTFTEDGMDVVANAWSDTDGAQPPYLFEEANLGRYSTGLGVCNTGEGSVASCTGNDPLHQVDNVAQGDWVLFQFDQNMIFESIVIDPFGNWDRDVTYFAGGTANPLDLTGFDVPGLAGLGFGPQVDDYNTQSSAPLTIDLGGVTGNSLLFGALFPPNGLKDRFKIRSLTATVVPVPAAVWMFGSALGMVVVRGRFRRKK